MLNALNFGTPVRLLSLTSAQVAATLPENGLMVYDSDTHKYIAYKDGGFDYFTMGSEIGVLDSSPDTYTPTEATVAGHLAGIDDYFVSLSSTIASTYLTQLDAAATYLTQVAAASTYATQEYVTSIAAGLDPKQAVRAATTAELSADYAIAADWQASTAYVAGDYVSGTGGNDTDIFKCIIGGTSDSSEPTWDVALVGNETVDNSVTWEFVRHGGGATLTNNGTQEALSVDGIALVAGERLLVKDQSSTAHNGIYVVTDIGSGSTNWVLTRAEDFDGTPDNEIDGGEYTFVQGGGTVNGGTTWVVINPAGSTIDVGVDPIVWSQSGNSPENITADVQLELDTLEGSIGAAVDGDGSFDATAFAGTNYLTSSLTLTSAMIDLDTQIASISVSLQDAYDGGNTIALDGSNLIISSVASEALEVTATGGIIANKLTSSGSGLSFVDDSASMVWDSKILHRYDGANSVAQEYVDGIAISPSTTAVISDLTVAHASWKSQILEYSLVDNSGNRRVGRLLITTDGTDVSVAHDYAETAAIAISWSAAINGANLEVSYTSGAIGVTNTMCVDVKRFRA
jgi:hypothetical protein